MELNSCLYFLYSESDRFSEDLVVIFFAAFGRVCVCVCLCVCVCVLGVSPDPKHLWKIAFRGC